jgi:hypothetical protein
MKLIITIWYEVARVLLQQIKEKIRGDGLLTAYYLLYLLP